MKIYRTSSYEALSRKAADLLAQQVAQKPDSVLGLATGSTPQGAYGQLIEMHRQGALDLSRVSAFNLDEYLGLGPGHPQSYAYYMDTHFFRHINIPAANIDIPNGQPWDVEAECQRYDAAIEAKGGMDLQVLGLGMNGHIGFNEPDSVFHRHTHCVELAESTIAANGRFFEQPQAVPRRAITMGIGPIMGARRIVMIVFGAQKADIVYQAFRGPITPAVPASILQLHPHVLLVGDAEALARL